MLEKKRQYDKNRTLFNLLKENLMRKKLIAGNWKMNGLTHDGISLAKDLANLYKASDNPIFDMFIAPPFTLLSNVLEVVKESGVWVGAQDCSMYDAGAHTGDVSPIMLKDLGCGGVIVGHSERRADHGETNEIVKAKAEAALKAGLGVIICVGETLRERETGKTLNVVKEQLQKSIPTETTAGRVVIAYEPVWAIGTGKTPTKNDVQEVHASMRHVLADVVGAEIAQNIRLLYGGSVKPNNAKDLLTLPDVDGALVGGASLKVNDFWAIAQAVM